MNPDLIHNPLHIAIVMDGNGRWANQRGLERKHGHREGSNAIDRLLDTALEFQLQNISLYAFSTENWKRPPAEIRAIFGLLDEFIDNKLTRLQQNDIRVLHSGGKTKLPLPSLRRIEKAIEKTAKNQALNLNFCLNYGSKDEITQAVNRILKSRKQSGIALDKPIKAADIEKNLYTFPLPPVDLMIRTAGEQRLSNFLLWQSAYAEMYFTDVLWPDFDRKSLISALEWYSKRERKFGGLSNSAKK